LEPAFLSLRVHPRAAPHMLAGKQIGGGVGIDLNKVRLNAVDLTDALRRDWVRIGRPLTPEERAGIHAHMRWCLGELTGLVRELEAEDA
jgi:hypothetical protein